MKPSLSVLAAALLLPLFATAQSAAPARPAAAEPYQGAWSVNAQEDSREKEAADVYSTPAASLVLLRRERADALARNNGKIPAQDKARLEDLALRIRTAAPNSFEAHMAAFHAWFPSSDAFLELDLAMARDASRQELIGPKLADATRRDNTQQLALWARALKDRGGVAPGLWVFADDLLRSVEQNGVLVAAGEMDAYPLLARQFADGVRRDVLVIDPRLLSDAAYRQRIWERTKARGRVPADEKEFVGRLAQATDRPLYLSPALGRELLGIPAAELYVVGLALRQAAKPVNNIPLLEAAWEKLGKTTEAGPLSRNYLLPGVVLLEHYRAQQDEQRASRMEHELRALARKLNATQELYRLGVFQH
jgi:hypothetical protein